MSFFPNGRDLLVVLYAELHLFEVGGDALGLNTLGNDGVSAVDAPCDEDLGGGGTELFRDFNDDRVISELGFVEHFMTMLTRRSIKYERK